ncbi:MAG: hypothetical protein A2W91_06620 [Bacteroidetes bacterium GWF2_38_335]|nr:MAG: hypothetical protein A2W91_06620 [Bacteroidetes bacterium GWF2_38_335]OFY77704.1 MAG: hypothetical protein A2281_18135 [Bacteroidetes bacterium RIFOXYA12_FULL_38_20]
MSKIKAIIIDDEKNSRIVLRNLLESEFGEIEIVSEASSADEAYNKINTHTPDLIFLDIQMPKANGFSLLKRFETIGFEIIFVTSFDNYAINAIKFSALDYLLKPVEIPDLRAAVQKAIVTIVKKENSQPQIINLINSISNENSDKKIAVHTGNKVKLISIPQIMYIEGDRRYCHLNLISGEKYALAKYLKDFEDFFENTSSFIRISKGFIINAAHIKEYSKGDPFIIKMANDITFEVARRRKKEILEKIKKF